MKLLSIKILIVYLINIKLCLTIRYDCEQRNSSCGCGFKNVEINEENIIPEEVIPYSWSMMVSIRYDCHQNGDPLTHCCSGTILNNQSVLTAAHCFGSSNNSLVLPTNLTILAGLHSLSQNCQTIRIVDQVYIHPNWSLVDDIMDNIAILHLAEPIDFNTNFILSQACVSSRINASVPTLDNTTLAVVGWNIFNDSSDNNQDKLLQQLVVHPMDYNASFCKKFDNSSKAFLCVGRYEASCFFGNGSSLFQWMGNRWELIGIESSTMDNCSQVGYKGHFLRIAEYTSWIESIINANNTTISPTNSVAPEMSSTTPIQPSIIYECNRTTSCGCSYSDVVFDPTRVDTSENVIDSSWSMIVSLRFYGTKEHSCAGTLLSNSFVLTTAHCVAHFLSTSSIDITVVAGITSQSDPSGYQRNVEEIYIHPNYTSSPNFHNNIALLRTDRPFIFQNNPILAKTCVQRSNGLSVSMNGTKFVVIGWGEMKPGNFVVSDYLRQIQVNLIDDQDQRCNNTIHDRELQFCAGLYDNATEPCLGDSGGPILQWTGDYWEQVGIIGHTFNCSRPGYPGIYTRLSSYWEWMETILLTKNERLEPQLFPISSSTIMTTTISQLPTGISTSIQSITTTDTITSQLTTTTVTMTMTITNTLSTDTQTTITASTASSLTTITDTQTMTATAITSTVKSQSTTTITSTTKQTTTAPRRKVTYECARRPNECGCSMTNVIVIENDPQLSSSSSTTNKIGEDAYPYSWSMIVSIQVNNTKHTCTGTILSDSFILTAAHCVEALSNNTMITIAAGIHTLSQYITSSRRVDQVFVHDSYINQEPYLHDIAILHLEQPLELNYQPIFSQICLSNTNSIDSIKTSNLFSVGWKHSNVLDNENSNNIQQVSIKSMFTQNSTCYNSIYDKTYQFCAGLILNHTDPCEENFGEPVFIYKNQYWEQVGILSNTYGCVPTGHSGVYTRLSAYTEWIKNIMKNTPIPMRSNKGLKLEENIFLFTILLLFLKIQF